MSLSDDMAFFRVVKFLVRDPASDFGHGRAWIEKPAPAGYVVAFHSWTLGPEGEVAGSKESMATNYANFSFVSAPPPAYEPYRQLLRWDQVEPMNERAQSIYAEHALAGQR